METGRKTYRIEGTDEREVTGFEGEVEHVVVFSCDAF